MRLTRAQADIVAPGMWLVILTSLGLLARPLLLPGAVITTLVLGIYYAARDASIDG